MKHNFKLKWITLQVWLSATVYTVSVLYFPYFKIICRHKMIVDISTKRIKLVVWKNILSLTFNHKDK